MAEKKQGRRPHYIREWAESRGWKAADIARVADVDKSMVSNWYGGSTPAKGSQVKLAKAFGTTPEGLFRHPDEAWFVDFFDGRSLSEVKRIKATLETAFPKGRGA